MYIFPEFLKILNYFITYYKFSKIFFEVFQKFYWSFYETYLEWLKNVYEIFLIKIRISRHFPLNFCDISG